MVLTYENLLTFSDFNFAANKNLKQLNSYAFLSFQDALHYLIKAYALKDKTILVPAFYCDATIHDMEKHGLHVELCAIDHKNFDVDVSHFIENLRLHQPDIIIIYNFFGKNSILYSQDEWKKYLKPDVIIISDFAHALIPNHKIEFINQSHFYIDSTRKTTCRMMANFIAPPNVKINKRFIVGLSAFRFFIRALYLIKSMCLRLATRFNSKFISNLGMKFYILHDKYIGSPINSFKGFWWDKFLYRRIKFEKIRQHKKYLYQVYQSQFAQLANDGHIEIISTDEDQENICFFFVRILNANVAHFSQWLQEKGFWVDTLWDFDAIKNISKEDKQWAKSIVVLPYTLRTKSQHIEQMASLMNVYFNEREHE